MMHNRFVFAESPHMLSTATAMVTVTAVAATLSLVSTIPTLVHTGNAMTLHLLGEGN